MAERIRVLILEDEALIAWELRDTLTDAGFEVVGIASRVRDALSIAENTRPHVAILDIRLRGERDGIEAALLLRQQFDVQVVMLTGQSDRVAEDKAAIAQAAAYLNKPISHRLLINAIKLAAAAALTQQAGPAVGNVTK